MIQAATTDGRGGFDPSAPVAAALSVEGIVKQYPGVRALDGVDFAVQPGEVRALLGKNGAGKSTLVKALSGVVVPDAGHIFINGEPVEIRTPSQAASLGIQTVHQELSLVPTMTVAENIALGAWKQASGAFGVLNLRAMDARARRALARLEVDIDPHETVSRLSVAHRQVVEIAKAIAHDPKVLILDEPTSSLPAEEVDVLLDLVTRLAKAGIAFIYVSHRMQEIPRIAHSVTVLRDGRHVATVPIAEATTAQIVEYMTGGTAHHEVVRRDAPTDRSVVLAVEGLVARPLVKYVSFELHEGEILGLAGLLGSGRSEVLRSIFGLDQPEHGTVSIEGHPIESRSPRAMVGLGVGMTPEDRKGEGLALGLSVGFNVLLASLKRLRRGLVLSDAREDATSRAVIKRLGIKVNSPETVCGTLSGGNQQKVLVGRWLAAGSRILLMDEPTRGVDIDAKEQFYAVARELAATGISIIVVSSEVEELFEMCDRLLVLNSGRIVADLPVAATTLDEVMTKAMEGSV